MKKQIFSVRTVSLLALLTIPAVIIFTVAAITTKPELVSTKSHISLPKVTTLLLKSGLHTSQLELYGEVSSPEELALLGEVSGRVVWKSDKFKLGQRVSEGELLVRLDEAQYRVEFADAKKQAADAYLALLQEQRNKRLAESDWKASGIKGDASELGLREPQLAIALAKYDAAKERLNLAKMKLAKTKILAPFDGVVVAQEVVLGSYVSQGGQIGRLKSTARAEVKLALTESQWHQLPSALDEIQAQVSARGADQTVWPAKASVLSFVLDQKTRTRNLTLVVDSPLEGTAPLLLGSFVKVSLIAGQVANSFALPASSVTADGFIWFEQDGKLYREKVAPLFYNPSTVTIARDKLASRLNLVRRPLSSYVEGMKVIATYAEGANYVK